MLLQEIPMLRICTCIHQPAIILNVSVNEHKSICHRHHRSLPYRYDRSILDLLGNSIPESATELKRAQKIMQTSARLPLAILSIPYNTRASDVSVFVITI